MAQVPAKQGIQGGALSTQREHPLTRLQHDFDTLFHTLWGGRLAPFYPEVEPIRMWDFGVTENEGVVTVRAELPGFEANELDVQLANDTLTIRAEKEQKGAQREEYRSFSRSMTVPSDIDAEKIQASYRNGVLELRMPRKEGALPKRIKVQDHEAGQPQALTGQAAQHGPQGGQAATNPLNKK